jgi:Holliday junction DNA helicase RuvB
VDRTLLLALARAGAVALGLKSLCAAVGEDERTLEDVYEPHLLREGYMVKTPQGRRITARGLALVADEAPDARAVPEAQGRLPL